MGRKGKLPTIGTQDFVRIANIVRYATHEAGRLGAAGYADQSRTMAHIAQLAAEVDSALYALVPVEPQSPTEQNQGEG